MNISNIKQYLNMYNKKDVVHPNTIGTLTYNLKQLRKELSETLDDNSKSLDVAESLAYTLYIVTELERLLQ